jgi:hypothetical protein
MSFRSEDRPLSINTECSGAGSSRSSFCSGDGTPFDLVTPRDNGYARVGFGDVLMSPKKKLMGSSGAVPCHLNLHSPRAVLEQTPEDVQRATLKSAAKTLPFSPNSSRKRPQSLSMDDESDLMHSGKKGSLQQLDAADDDGSGDEGIGTPCQLFLSSGSADCDSPFSDEAMFCSEVCSDDGVPSRGSIAGRRLLAENCLTRTMSANFGFCEHFFWLKKLGSGSFSHVWLCEHNKTGEFFAVKADQRPLKGKKDRDLHLREINAVIEIGQHEYIVQYFRSWQEDRFFFSQMEFCEYGCLQQLCANQALSLGCGGKDWPVIGRIVHDTISGLAAIHSHNLLHLDIKPGRQTLAIMRVLKSLIYLTLVSAGNIFICATGKLKIGDLGLCVRASSWDDEEGDRIYLARELLENKAGPHCDIFSAGVTFLELIQQAPAPKDGDKWHALRDGVVEIPESTPESLRVLLLRMLHPDWAMRPSCAEILRSDFLQAFNPSITGALINVASLPCHSSVQQLKPTYGNAAALKLIKAQDNDRNDFPMHMQHLFE